jgi:hypothetical protein
MQPYQPSEPTWQPQPDPAGYYPPSSTPSSSQPPPPQAYQPGTYGQQSYQQPGHQQPGHQQPAYQQPAYGQPANGHASYQQPAHQQPAYGHAAYQQGSYDQSSYGQGSYQQPATPSYLQTSSEARDALKSKGTRDIVFGAVWLAVGLGITVVTFAMMDGAAMIVAWGPALYGIYKIVKGLITVSRNG